MPGKFAWPASAAGGGHVAVTVTRKRTRLGPRLVPPRGSGPAREIDRQGACPAVAKLTNLSVKVH
jgi:hypothetical protein